MKICLVSDTLPGYHEIWSGAELVCWRLGERLQKEGHEVAFLTTKFKKKNNSGRVFQIPTPLDKFAKFIPFFPSFSTHFPIDLYSIVCSFILLKKIKPDVIHFHAKKLFLPIMVANLFLKIPTVFTTPDYFIVCPINTLLNSSRQICIEIQGADCFKCVYYTKHRLKKTFQPIWIKKAFPEIRAKIFYYFIRKLDKIVALTNTNKNRLEKHGIPEGKIKVIYYQLINSEINRIEPKITSSNTPTILFVGSFYPHKGLQILIQAIPFLVSEIPKVKLLVVGTGDQYRKEEIKKLVNNLKIGQSIDFLGQRKNEEVLELILESDVVVVPEQWFNDFGPVILLEAMVLGRPVVASKIGGIPQFVKDGFNGFLAEHNQPNQFAGKIIRLLKDENLANLMGKRAKESTKFLFNNNQIKEIIKLYNQLIKTS